MDITVHHAELVMVADAPCWVLTTEHSDTPGEIRAHLMPIDQIETRAAEYGIDPDAPGAWDQLVNMVLFEPYLDDGVAVDDPRTLHRAPSVDEAREFHLARIAKRRGRGRARGLSGKSAHMATDRTRHQVLVDSGDVDPLDTVRRFSPMSREHMAVKAEHVGRQREHLARTQPRRGARFTAGTDWVWDRPSADELRAELMPTGEDHAP